VSQEILRDGTHGLLGLLKANFIFVDFDVKFIYAEL